MSKTIIALDFSSRQEVMDFLRQFKEPVSVKIGMELTYAEGLDMIREIVEAGHEVFVDLKLHDIPNTVKGGMKNLASLGASILNCHAAGGIEMMKAAKTGLDEGAADNKKPLLIAVTQLTSTSKEAMNEEQGIPGEVIDSVVRYAKNAKEAGLDGVVCSVHEVEAIKKACGPEFLCVTPGIRLASNSVDDQKRVATPELAKERGSDYIVVGRSITKAENPVEIFNEIEAVMQS
ncbi:orotidine-5'-phosphate decarboxylase [Ileibacterium valens]|uniref:Orotidine 5'-phosphate decarboxylase n=1 Tax=Ileibacterium valens TaxID=1862668 RepID=A0A1U7NGR3_9FIRM|nr:orotidine-5'-phosphate decarboxylase [Ileibacterium valens]OLU39114.1 orotidine 5'-phosphate decarboxylase [Erysipelotrichaceae bacterium NYU-BL-F16]OLU40221.1 orotidine 5'-phosphate decarboxylase [Erysipelotrichaceae bacterium NYU-BL-E8]OLU40420.1 orotidine 5'-phosphate decarboxylase [Ileibacterium valens]